MRVVIVEDETAAAQNLAAILRELVPSLEILETLESVEESVAYFEKARDIDLIFMDIHLADGQAFRIFDKVKISTPIIFTTAYDRYALEAFKVNSIDYILKPLKVAEVERALKKLSELSSSEMLSRREQTEEVAAKLNQAAHSLLVHSKDRIIPIPLEQIAFFYTEQGATRLYTLSGESYNIDKSLETIQSSLPADKFIRANRQFLVARLAIKDMSIWFGSRLSLNLSTPTPERIIIAKAKVGEFKRWLLSE
ncbi:MAG: LytTR family DNA-binding domain-containing protein [Rikenellaceae bacterium]